MKPSFDTLSKLGKAVLTEATGWDYRDTDMRNWFCCTVYDHDMIAAVLACEAQNSFEWRFTAAIADPRAITRRLLRSIFRALFTSGVRVTALVDPDNDAALRLMERLGFVYEGYARRGLDGRRDACVYGMLPEDCPWIYSNPALLRRVPRRAEMH